ncbi:helix-turn-helix domain-containing protein [Mesorhizobium sp. AA23]|uniref:helix-turn-helix domain-containing protein n=1 Tax=Mesorhizobium TaxID=68287 RepID=UPI001FDA3B66|nr:MULTISPECIES: helix-turn-helix domain-containing protein [Mesorhizobium]
MIDIGGNDGPSARHLVTHEFRSDEVGDRSAEGFAVALEFAAQHLANASQRLRPKGSTLTPQPATRRQASEVLRLKAEGKSAGDIAAALGISRASVFRILAENEGA